MTTTSATLTHRSRFRPSAAHLTLVAICAAAFCSATASAQQYLITEIGERSDPSPTYALALNGLGQVAGTSGAVAFHFANNMKENLGSLLGGKTSRAFSINALGDVAGDSTFNDSGISHATLFIKGEAIDLGTLAKFGEYSVAKCINDSRQVVGFGGPEADSDASRAFIWDEVNGMQMLDTLGGDYSQAVAISNSGFVTGNAQQNFGSPTRHAFLWHPKFGIVDLGTLGNSSFGTVGGNSSYGTSVNEQGHVVGYSGYSADDAQIHAFLYDGQTMRDLGSLNPKRYKGNYSVAYGVNSNDDVVGTSVADLDGVGLAYVAFVYQNGTMTDLNTITDLGGLPYRLQTATAINDAGQITVQALDLKTGTVRSLLLTPVRQ